MGTVKGHLLSAAAALALLVCLGIGVSAADQAGRTSLSLPKVDGAKIQFDEGGEFFAFENVLPGDSLTQDIKISNQRGETVTFYLMATSELQAVKLLEQCTLRLTQDNNNNILYEGNLTGRPVSAYDEGMIGDGGYGISLGQVAAGGSTQLRAYIHVPLSVDNDFAKAIGLIRWEIRAQIPDPEPSVSDGGNGGSATPSTSSPPEDSEPGASKSSTASTVSTAGSSSSSSSTSSSSSSSSSSTGSSSRTYYNLGGVDVQPAAATARPVDVIDDGDVPLAGDLFKIADDQTPLASLPRTGGQDGGVAVTIFTVLTTWGLWKKP